MTENGKCIRAHVVNSELLVKMQRCVREPVSVSDQNTVCHIQTTGEGADRWRTMWAFRRRFRKSKQVLQASRCCRSHYARSGRLCRAHLFWTGGRLQSGRRDKEHDSRGRTRESLTAGQVDGGTTGGWRCTTGEGTRVECKKLHLYTPLVTHLGAQPVGACGGEGARDAVGARCRRDTLCRQKE